MSSDSWLGHQSRLVLPRSDRSARGSLAGSLSGSPLVFASMSLGPLLSDESRRIGSAPHGRKRLNLDSQNWKIDQGGGEAIAEWPSMSAAGIRPIADVRRSCHRAGSVRKKEAVSWP